MTLRRMLNTYTDLSSINDHGRAYYDDHFRSSSNSNSTLFSAATCAALGVGAGLMYLFDPTLGRRRRHVLRDKLVSSVHQLGDCCDATTRDFANRTRGVFH